MTPAPCGGRHRVTRIESTGTVTRSPPAQRQAPHGRSAAQSRDAPSKANLPDHRGGRLSEPARRNEARVVPAVVRHRVVPRAGRTSAHGQGTSGVAGHERKWWTEAASEHRPRPAEGALGRSSRRSLRWSSGAPLGHDDRARVPGDRGSRAGRSGGGPNSTVERVAAAVRSSAAVGVVPTPVAAGGVRRREPRSGPAATPTTTISNT